MTAPRLNNRNDHDKQNKPYIQRCDHIRKIQIPRGELAFVSTSGYVSLASSLVIFVRIFFTAEATAFSSVDPGRVCDGSTGERPPFGTGTGD